MRAPEDPRIPVLQGGEYVKQDTVAALNNLVASVQAQLELDARPSKLQQALNGDQKAAREILMEMNVIDEHGNLTPYYS